MSHKRLSIYASRRLVFSDTLADTVQLGRQRAQEELLFRRVAADGVNRIAVAPLDDTQVPRSFVQLRSGPGRAVIVTNLHERMPVRFDDGRSVAAQSSAEFMAPLLIVHGALSIRIEEEVAEQHFETLQRASIAPGSGFFASVKSSDSEDVSVEEVLTWFRAVTALLECATNSSDFFNSAARGLVDLIGLDRGAVLLYEPSGWRLVATAPKSIDEGEQRPPSRQVLNCLVDEKRTLWQKPADASPSQSLSELEAVVASPILDRNGELVGALYGDRGQSILKPCSVSRLEAQLVETLAGGVAAGLARLTEEHATVRAQVQFEQFFTPELSNSLAADPDMLAGREAEITVLFCDVRGFSRLSERLGPAGTVSWIGSVMEALSECVVANRGVLVDYIGDELMAMWGAPSPQDDHAQLAVATALAIMNCLPKLNEQWAAVLGEDMRVGIGINSGRAHVGNTGSQRKFKYGPLGPMVNLASRLQGATKYLKTDVLLTAATNAHLGDDLSRRRLCTLRVVNIAEPVEVFELCPASTPAWQAAAEVYHRALSCFELHKYAEAAQLLTGLLEQNRQDGPALLLLSRVVAAMTQEDADGELATPIWTLPGK